MSKTDGNAPVIRYRTSNERVQQVGSVRAYANESWGFIKLLNEH